MFYKQCFQESQRFFHWPITLHQLSFCWSTLKVLLPFSVQGARKKKQTRFRLTYTFNMFLYVVLVLVLTTCKLTLPWFCEVKKKNKKPQKTPMVFTVFWYFIQLPKSQNHWMTQVGRDLWRSPYPTSLLKKVT